MAMTKLEVIFTRQIFVGYLCCTRAEDAVGSLFARPWQTPRQCAQWEEQGGKRGWGPLLLKHTPDIRVLLSPLYATVSRGTWSVFAGKL